MTTEPIDLDAAQALADAATPGPWTWVHDEGSSWDCLTGPAEYENLVLWANGVHTEGWINADPADAAFIAQARTLVPALIAELIEARATIVRLREAIETGESSTPDSWGLTYVYTSQLRKALGGGE
jgi:hypothetical protein